MLKEKQLQKHILATYSTLRVGIAIISILFPLLLWFGGKRIGVPLGDSMSAYYHLSENGASMRDWFVGILFAISISIYLYKGYSTAENNALNIAGVLGIGIAVFPAASGASTDTGWLTPHGVSAAGFFVCIAYVCLFRAEDTIHLLRAEDQNRFRNLYKLIGLSMLLSPLSAFIAIVLLQKTGSFVFFIEAFGIWAFATYWLVKSREITVSNAEDLALHSQL